MEKISRKLNDFRIGDLVTVTNKPFIYVIWNYYPASDTYKLLCQGLINIEDDIELYTKKNIFASAKDMKLLKEREEQEESYSKAESTNKTTKIGNIRI